MLFVLSALKECAVKASDGRIGTVKDFLFDEKTWRVRWMVVHPKSQPGRKVLIHPRAIAPLDVSPPSSGGLGLMGMGPKLTLCVRLTRAQIEASPDVREDEPVSRQIESRIHDFYGWEAYWSAADQYQNMSTIAAGPPRPPPYLAEPAIREPANAETLPPSADGDPHLRSVNEVNGYHVHATDGDIGHIEHLLADDEKWDIHYFVIDTRNWWPGKHVLLAPYAVQSIDWSDRHILLNVTRDQVRSSPPWDPLAMTDQIGERRLQSHYGWPGYGW
jgi:hypothetical protein